MEIKDIYLKYGVLNSITVSRKQRIRYLTSLKSDFEDLGYKNMKIVRTKIKRKETIMGLVGDIKKSDYLFITHYDTPLVSFTGQSHDPFNDKQLEKNSKVNYLVPMIALTVILLSFAILVLIPSLSNGVFSFLDLVWVAVALFIMLMLTRVTQYSGVPKRYNLIRNNSSVVSLLNLARTLTLKERNKVAFAFVDYGCTDYFGHMVLSEFLENDKQKTVILDSVGNNHIEISTDKSNMLRNKFNNTTFIYGSESDEEIVSSLEETTIEVSKVIKNLIL